MKLQQFRRFSAASYIQAQRTQLVLPPFTLEVPTWIGASSLLAEYAIGNTTKISLRKPIAAFGENFVVAVRWRVDDVFYRFVFWTDDTAVLFFPVYNGEVIGESATIEIWSVNSEEAPTLDANAILESSILVFPSECNACCSQPSSQTLLVQTGPIVLPPGECNPFCDAVPSVTGACTIGEACSIMTEAACLEAGGTYGGDGSVCPSPPAVPNQPAWPVPTPWVGSAWYGPIHAPDAAFPSFFVGVNPGSGDPTIYTDGISPGATAAWVAELWRNFLIDVPSYTSARIIWGFVNLSGTNYTGYSVFPAMNPDLYTTQFEPEWSPVVEYIV